MNCRPLLAEVFLAMVDFYHSMLPVSGLGYMSAIAVSYGVNGPMFCGLSSDGSLLVSCFGADPAVVHGAPFSFPFSGLSARDGFVCGPLLVLASLLLEKQHLFPDGCPPTHGGRFLPIEKSVLGTSICAA
ncbi:Serine threonine-protein kinase-like protein [Asimina triloba]